MSHPTMELFVTTFGRAPTPMEATWLVQWSDQITKGEMTMTDVGHLLNLNPEPTTSPSDTVPAAPVDDGPVSFDTVTALDTTVSAVLGRSSDVLSLHQMLGQMENAGGSTHQIVLNHALSEGANPNDRAVIDAKTDNAIDYLVAQGWDGHSREQAQQAVSGTDRSAVVNPAWEPPSSLLLTDERWAFFSDLRDTHLTGGETHAANARVDQVALINVLNLDDASRPAGVTQDAVYDSLLGKIPANDNAGITLNGSVSYDLRDGFDTLIDAPAGVMANAVGYTLNDAASRFEGLTVEGRLSDDERGVLDGAGNRAEFHYSLTDNLSQFAQAAQQDDIFTGLDGYRLADARDAFEGLSIAGLPDNEALTQQMDIMAGADNGAQYQVTIADSLAAMLGREDAGWVELVDGYRLTDDPARYVNMPVDQLPDSDTLTSQLEWISGASNGEAYTLTVADSLDALLAREDAGWLDLVAGYRLTDDPATFENRAPGDQLTDAELALINGASNSDDYSYTVAGDEPMTVADLMTLKNDVEAAGGSLASYTLADTLDALQGAEEGLLAGADSYALTDPADAFQGISPDAQLSDEALAILNGATNRGDYDYGVAAPQALTVADALILQGEAEADGATFSYTLADTLDALQGAEEGLLAGADSYALTDPADAFVALPYDNRLSAAEVATLGSADNAGDYVAYSVVPKTAQSVSELQSFREALNTEAGQPVAVANVTLEDTADAVTQARADGVDVSGVTLTIHTDVEGTTAESTDGMADRFLIDDDPATSGVVLDFDAAEDTLALMGLDAPSVVQYLTTPTDPSAPVAGDVHVFGDTAADEAAIEALLGGTRFADGGDQTLVFHDGVDTATAWDWSDGNTDGIVQAGELDSMVDLVGVDHSHLLQFNDGTFA